MRILKNVINLYLMFVFWIKNILKIYFWLSDAEKSKIGKQLLN